MKITANSILDAWRIEPTLTYCGFDAAPRLARRLCRAWFPTCNDCELMRGKN